MNTIRVQAPIDGVTVTEDRAYIERHATVELPAGVTRLRIEDVAPVVADKTLRLRASGPVTIGDLRVVRQKVASLPAEAHAALVRDLEVRIRESELAAANTKRLQGTLSLLHEAQRRVLEELAEDAARGIADEATLSTHARAFEERERSASAELVEAHRLQVELDKTIGRLRTRLAQAGHQEVRRVAAIEVTLSAADSGPTDLVITYLVPGACWRPQHTATLVPAKTSGAPARLTVSTDACVWQNTGEDWTSVSLQLSTERPSLGQKPPTLGDDEVVTRRKTEVVQVSQRDQIIEHTGLGGAPPARVPGIDDGGEVRLLVARSRATVPSDGRPHRIPSLSMDTEAQPSFVAYPELAEAVLLQTEQTNAGASPLLAGPVDLVRESGFVGHTKVDLIAPGERFKLGFGPDPHVRLRREVVAVDEDKGLIPSSYVGRSHHVRVHLSNLDDRPREIDVTERIPVSEIEKVEVRFDEQKTFPRAQPDPDGFVRWHVSLAARGRATLELRYVVKRHKDVVGL